MYLYRRSTPGDREKLVEERVERRFPPHSPPHTALLERTYMITAACYEHRALMHTEARRFEFADKLKRSCSASGSRVEAWVVLPNHYHLLVETPDLSAFGRTIRHVHGCTSHQ